MKATILSFFFRSIVRLYPRAWRKRYQAEILDVFSQADPRWRDVFDLLRSVGNEWRRRLARLQEQPLHVVATAYLLMVATWAVPNTILALIDFVAPPHQFLHRDFRGVYMTPVTIAMFGIPVLLLTLSVNGPLIVLLRLTRRRVSILLARFVLAAGFVTWGEWMLYQLGHDDWSMGIPGIRYWIAALVWGSAFAIAGAIIGGALVRGGKGQTHLTETFGEAQGG